jgi:hypothetical protein
MMPVQYTQVVIRFFFFNFKFFLPMCYIMMELLMSGLFPEEGSYGTVRLEYAYLEDAY